MSMIGRFRISLGWGANLSFAILMTLLFLLSRVPSTQAIFNIDENIAPAVVTGMVQRGDLNGNWKVAVDIPADFHVNQFNFYSFHLVARLFYSDDRAQFIENLRFVNVALQAATLLLLLSYIAKLGLTARHRIAAIALFVLAPALVCDTHIARCESFLYFHFALMLWTTQAHGRPFLRYAAFGVLLGVGCASKITFILCGAILIPEIVATFRIDAPKVFRQVGTLVVASLFGFVATAPYVLIDFNAFLDGVHALFKQYGTTHPPHSFLQASLSKSIWRTLVFILLTTGALLPLALFQTTRRPVNAPGLALFGFLVVAYFATKPVFFERNIGIGLLALLIFVAVNIRNRAEILLVVASCGLMFYWSYKIAYVFGHSNTHERRFEEANFGAQIPRIWPIEGLDARLATCTGMIAVFDFNDDHSRKMIEEAHAVPVAHFSSVFAVLPTSTLHTYLESDLLYYRCRNQGPN